MIGVDRSGSASSIGWLTSLSLHAALAFGALVVTQRLALGPQPLPFTWNVALVSAPSEPLQPSTVSTAIQAPTIKTPSPAPVNNAAPTPAVSAGFSKPLAVEPTSTTSLEPMSPLQEASHVLDSPPLVEAPAQESTVKQTEPIPSTAQSPAREPEPPAEVLSRTPAVPQGQESVVPAQSPIMSPSQRPDYAWLSEIIMRRMQELKKYPAEARLDRAEGRVVLKAVIRNDGTIEGVEVFQSSGHQILDRAAVDLLNLAAPFQFPRSMEKPHMTVKIPMNYRLEP